MKKFVLLPLLVAVWLLTGLVAQGKAPSPSGGEHEPVRKNADNRLADIGGLVSGFGGMYIDPDNPDVLNVFLLDSASKEKKENVEDAIRSNFPGSIPSGGIAVVQGQYSMSQLQDWYAKVIKAMASTNLVGNGLVGTDLEEDKNRLEIAVEDSEAAAVVEGVLAGLADVPRDAVRVTVRGALGSCPALRACLQTQPAGSDWASERCLMMKFHPPPQEREDFVGYSMKMLDRYRTLTYLVARPLVASVAAPLTR